MKPSEVYFKRNQGHWDWKIDILIPSFIDLLKADISLISKLRMISLYWGQKLFGHLKVTTFVDFKTDQKQVIHYTNMSKWKMTFYKSKKIFSLLDDGQGLTLEGVEYFWPLIFMPIKFKTMNGHVHENAIHASYKMPLAGTFCDCTAFLGPTEGYATLKTSWFLGKLTLLENSKEKLAQSFS